MANQHKMAVVQAILTLARLGWSQRRIAGELGIDRETVARYVHSPPGDSKPATNPIPGSVPRRRSPAPTVTLRPIMSNRGHGRSTCHRPQNPRRIMGEKGKEGNRK
jgi:transposase